MKRLLMILFIFFWYAGTNGVKMITINTPFETAVVKGELVIYDGSGVYVMNRIYFSYLGALGHYRRNHVRTK